MSATARRIGDGVYGARRRARAQENLKRDDGSATACLRV
jgi:hypothetical protein